MRTPLRENSPGERVKNFSEVSLGYNEEEALKEAERCLQCKNPVCVEGCPAKIDIPGFIKLIKNKKYPEALEKIKENNNLPGVCGRVCPHETQCELKCILNPKKEQISIAALERFAADNGGNEKIPKIKKLKKKVAVVGSGPSALTCAADLALKGYDVTMHEALHKPGGVLQYGIPEFRLPRKILKDEIEYIKKLGVKLVVDFVVGKSARISELAEDYDAVFIGTGAGLPRFMGIPGEELNNVYSANEFLVRVNLMKAHKFPEYHTPVKKGSRVIVIGGGNVAIDAARVAKRLGADVTILYRRSFDEMPAKVSEVRHAQEEGIEFLMLTLPLKILGEEEVIGVECVQMRLGEEDETGRKEPIPIEGTDLVLECDQVVMAIGQTPNPIIAKTKEVMVGGRGQITVNENMQSSIKNVFAGGDAISGSATVIKAIGDGKKAAAKIDEYLKGDN